MLARLCSERSNKHINEACVYLYSRMGWHEEAVELALTGVNVELAKEVANFVQPDSVGAEYDELRKALWLRIARHVIEKENDVTRAMQLLHELTADTTIAIEDVLPYFPEFVTIDQFKDAIRTSLAAYTERIASLKDNIEQAARSAQLIRRDIQLIRQKSITVNTSDSCAKCKFRLMTRRFYVFPCMHKFHADCLYHTSLPYLVPAKQRRIDELQKLLQDIQTMPHLTVPMSQASTANNSSLMSNAFSQISKATNKMVSHQQSGGGSSSQQLLMQAAQQQQQQQTPTYSMDEILRVKSELDELLANECPWCGECILQSIDKPFIDPLNYDAVFNSWL
jgi:hypothetical protein